MKSNTRGIIESSIHWGFNSSPHHLCQCAFPATEMFTHMGQNFCKGTHIFPSSLFALQLLCPCLRIFSGTAAINRTLTSHLECWSSQEDGINTKITAVKGLGSEKRGRNDRTRQRCTRDDVHFKCNFEWKLSATVRKKYSSIWWRWSTSKSARVYKQLLYCLRK